VANGRTKGGQPQNRTLTRITNRTVADGVITNDVVYNSDIFEKKTLKQLGLQAIVGCSMSIDHDQIFKVLIEAFFREFMLLFCPAEAVLIDFTRVEFLRKEYFTDTQRGKRRSMDLVVKVWLKSGTEQFILIHIEFESTRPMKDFARRIYRYSCQLFLRYDVEIVPIVVFTDDAVWRKPVDSRLELGIAGKTIVRFEYYLVKLKSLNYKEFLSSQNPLAYALMAKMDYNRKEQARMKADFLRLILGSPVDPARQSLLIEFVETYVPLIGEDFNQFEQLIRTENQYAEVEQMVTVYEQRGIEQGIEKGIEQGIKKGIEKGIKKGIKKGIEKGIEKGLLAGKVQMLEQILGRAESELSILEKLSLAELQARLDDLQLVLKKKKSSDL